MVVAGEGGPIFHIADRAEWEAQAGSPVYRPAAYADEGFVHCSTARQVGPTLDRHFGNRTDLVLLEIDPERLGAELRWERAPAVGEDFPHVHGPIEREAVVGVHPHPWGDVAR